MGWTLQFLKDILYVWHQFKTACRSLYEFKKITYSSWSTRFLKRGKKYMHSNDVNVRSYPILYWVTAGWKNSQCKQFHEHADSDGENGAEELHFRRASSPDTSSQNSLSSNRASCDGRRTNILPTYSTDPAISRCSLFNSRKAFLLGKPFLNHSWQWPPLYVLDLFGSQLPCFFKRRKPGLSSENPVSIPVGRGGGQGWILDNGGKTENRLHAIPLTNSDFDKKI